MSANNEYVKAIETDSIWINKSHSQRVDLMYIYGMEFVEEGVWSIEDLSFAISACIEDELYEAAEGFQCALTLINYIKHVY